MTKISFVNSQMDESSILFKELEPSQPTLIDSRNQMYNLSTMTKSSNVNAT
jgi:hypothetical protein